MGAVSGRDRLRRLLLVLGVIVTAFGVLHHVDHVVRGHHSGWPFREAVMWLPLHKDPAVIDRRVIRARSTEVPHNALTVQPD
jgi:hypothetical protein